MNIDIYKRAGSLGLWTLTFDRNGAEYAGSYKVVGRHKVAVDGAKVQIDGAEVRPEYREQDGEVRVFAVKRNGMGKPVELRAAPLKTATPEDDAIEGAVDVEPVETSEEDE